MLKRAYKVYITSIDNFGKKRGYPDSSTIINYCRAPLNQPTKFAEISRAEFPGKQMLELVKKLERALLDNRPVNLVIRTNEIHPEEFDQVIKVELT